MMQITVYSIAFECPFFQRNNSCPLSEKDCLSNMQKIDWVDKLGNEKMKEIFVHHRNCLNKRESK